MIDLVQVKLEGGVGELILNRPQRRNALIGPLVTELHEGLDTLNANPDCHSILLRGAGGYFCAGMDLKEMSATPPPAWRQSFPDNWAAFHDAVYRTDKPIVGALEGFAIAGGSALALACDFLIVGKESFFHVAEVERGMFAPINIAWLILRYGHATAIRLAVQGRRHYGDELVRMGLAEVCVEEGQVLSSAREFAGRFSGLALDAIVRNKRGVRLGRNLDFLALLDNVKDAAK
jgi:enoyl-CoA hydratase/carnithine racemase